MSNDEAVTIEYDLNGQREQATVNLKTGTVTFHERELNMKRSRALYFRGDRRDGGALYIHEGAAYRAAVDAVEARFGRAAAVAAAGGWAPSAIPNAEEELARFMERHGWPALAFIVRTAGPMPGDAKLPFVEGVFRSRSRYAASILAQLDAMPQWSRSGGDHRHVEAGMRAAVRAWERLAADDPAAVERFAVAVSYFAAPDNARCGDCAVAVLERGVGATCEECAPAFLPIDGCSCSACQDWHDGECRACALVPRKGADKGHARVSRCAMIGVAPEHRERHEVLTGVTVEPVTDLAARVRRTVVAISDRWPVFGVRAVGASGSEVRPFGEEA